ncbi:MAG: NAD(P)H-hydrate epimerase, partial [Parvibaculum sedimenti]|uniref:NAD(P)H-hydrate epimerase n=1 Tax=Parvibaculum sedimenti TaxID=2608632 RepID=UPI003BB59B93
MLEAVCALHLPHWRLAHGGYSGRMFDTRFALLSVEEMARSDRLTIDGGKPGIELMENAGRLVAEAVAARFPRGPVSVLCGPGNNGGDGFIAARLLRDWGWGVTLFLLGERERLTGDAAEAAHRWAGPVHPLTADAAQGASFVVDGIFGAGLSREVTGVVAELIGRVNEAKLPVAAIDVPTGLDGDTGEVRGAAFEAKLTVTFFRKKPGHMVFPGRRLCGELVVGEIGTAEGVLDEIKPTTFENAPEVWAEAFPRPSVEGHKYSRGHAVVVSGGPSSTGAARLGARGALRAG